MASTTDIILNYVCPSLGCIMSSLMFAAPVRDLRKALLKGRLGPLNPFPWVMMTGNCFGWVVYGYYTNDAFIVAANIPGLILSIWLNSGASKLQYQDLWELKKQDNRRQPEREHWDASPMDSQEELRDEVPDDSAERTAGLLILTPQERSLLRVLTTWAIVVTYVGWFSKQSPSAIVGIVVNANLVFFYGAPLQTMRTVINSRNSESIHVPTMFMNWCNTSFWIAYGFARRDVIIILPNAIGLSLGLIQGVLCLLYPRQSSVEESDLQPLQHDEDALEDQVPTNDDGCRDLM